MINLYKQFQSGNRHFEIKLMNLMHPLSNNSDSSSNNSGLDLKLLNPEE